MVVKAFTTIFQVPMVKLEIWWFNHHFKSHGWTGYGGAFIPYFKSLWLNHHIWCFNHHFKSHVEIWWCFYPIFQVRLNHHIWCFNHHFKSHVEIWWCFYPIFQVRLNHHIWWWNPMIRSTWVPARSPITRRPFPPQAPCVAGCRRGAAAQRLASLRTPGWEWDLKMVLEPWKLVVSPSQMLI